MTITVGAFKPMDCVVCIDARPNFLGEALRLNDVFVVNRVTPRYPSGNTLDLFDVRGSWRDDRFRLATEDEIRKAGVERPQAPFTLADIGIDIFLKATGRRCRLVGVYGPTNRIDVMPYLANGDQSSEVFRNMPAIAFMRTPPGEVRPLPGEVTIEYSITRVPVEPPPALKPYGWAQREIDIS